MPIELTKEGMIKLLDEFAEQDRKKDWRTYQSPESKEFFLKKAEEKRQRKLRRQKLENNM